MPFDTMKELVLSGVYAMKEGADAPVGLSAPTAADSCCARRARALAMLAVPARSPPRCICRRQRLAPNQLTAACSTSVRVTNRNKEGESPLSKAGLT